MDDKIQRFNDRVVEILRNSKSLEDYENKIENLINNEVEGTYYEDIKLDIIDEYGEAAILKFTDTREMDRELGL